ncbi:MAG: 23S rRNA (uracil(1939)-C(5))-methyltransferase RlmD [Magnetococcus sp. XQGC-1]
MTGPGAGENTNPERFPLQIEKIVPGGLGLGFHAGMAVFVPFTAPGEEILAEVTRRRPGSLFARCVQVLTPGAGRVDPGCALFTRCGGCQLRHLHGGVQQTIKGAFVQETLSRFPNLREPEPLPTWAAVAQGDGYRCRAGFKVRWVGGGLLLGFFQAASHQVADLTASCPVLDPRLNHILPPLRQLLSTLSVRQRLPQVDAVVGEDGIGLVLHLLSAATPRDLTLLQQFARSQGVIQLWLQRGRKSGMHPVVQDGELSYRVDSHLFRFHPGDFIQAHQAGNSRLLQEVLQQGGSGGVAWDLFCGVGNFTLPLAERFARVLGVDGYAPALQRAEHNVGSSRSASVRFRCLDLFQEAEIAQLSREESADLVLLDPPREGALSLVKWLLGTPSKRLVYVSCNPATFARDAAILVHGGFSLERVQPLDLFPQTAHVELVALFVRDRTTA